MPRRRSGTERGRPAASGHDRLAEVRRLRELRERRADLALLAGLLMGVAAVWAAVPAPG